MNPVAAEYNARKALGLGNRAFLYAGSKALLNSETRKMTRSGDSEHGGRCGETGADCVLCNVTHPPSPVMSTILRQAARTVRVPDAIFPLLFLIIWEYHRQCARALFRRPPLRAKVHSTLRPAVAYPDPEYSRRPCPGLISQGTKSIQADARCAFFIPSFPAQFTLNSLL